MKSSKTKLIPGKDVLQLLLYLLFLFGGSRRVSWGHLKIGRFYTWFGHVQEAFAVMLLTPRVPKGNSILFTGGNGGEVEHGGTKITVLVLESDRAWAGLMAGHGHWK